MSETGSRNSSEGISIPDHWFNLVAQIPWTFPLPHNADGEIETVESLAGVYSQECARIEMLDGEYRRDPLISVPGAVLDEYAKYRPSRLQRARGLERRLDYGGQIFFKREDGNPTGSHKPNTAIAQAYYAHKQNLKGLVTDTGAGQWGAALAWACHSLGLECAVFMTRNSFVSKPYRRYLMHLSGARVFASPSDITSRGRALLETDKNHRGSLGIGMGEAMEFMRTQPDTRLALGCMSYYAALHQTVIGQELVAQLELMEISPDILIGCVGGGTNFIGFVAPFASDILPAGLNGSKRPRLVAVESANIPVLTKGAYDYEFADAFGLTTQVKMYTLGREFLPDEIHAGGLRYHGKSPILSLLVHERRIEAVAVDQEDAFVAGKLFFEAEGILAAPESSHAIAQVIKEVKKEKEAGTTPTIVFCLSGTGYLDLQSYAAFFGAN
ncbi:MAG: TrpB-like pyridoxal phosphate-dependent enzyme [Pyrinomonadaceae bacterium]